MLWKEVRERLPHKWLIVETIAARTEGDGRLLEDVAVIEESGDGWAALERQSVWQRQWPDREFHSVHTDQVAPMIREKPMLGIRGIRWN